MPWKAKRPMDLKMEFMTRLQRGERMTDLCVEYEISRKTGHKLKNRYEALGPLAMQEQSRAPKVIPHKTPPELVELLVSERRAHPSWGPKKLKVVLEQRLGHAFPSRTTIGDILVRAKLIERKPTRPRYRPRPTGLSDACCPNDGWSIDYKGQFRLGDGSYCYPLTLSDQYSRFILGCDGMAAIQQEQARQSCELVFRQYGLPRVIRSDNGTPFASLGLAHLTKLSVYFLRLGIKLERIRPSHPEENGRHERMHRTLKRETTRPARHNLLQQQQAFDAFIEEFNQRRPHEALGMQCPGQVYTKSARRYPDRLAAPEYPTHDDTLEVDAQGRIRLHQSRCVYISEALSGQLVGIREEEPERWLVSFLNLDLGYIEPDRRFTALGPDSVSHSQNV